MSGKRHSGRRNGRRNGRKGPKGRSVDASVHKGLARRLERMTADYNAAQRRIDELEGLLLAVVAKAGGIAVEAGYLRPGRYSLLADELPNGMMLTVVDETLGGQEGKRNGDDTDERSSVGACSGEDPPVQASSPPWA